MLWSDACTSLMKAAVQILVGQGYLDGGFGKGNIKEARQKFEEALQILNDGKPWNVSSYSQTRLAFFPFDSASLHNRDPASAIADVEIRPSVGLFLCLSLTRKRRHP